MEKYIEKSKVERMLWAVIMSKDERTIEEMLEDAPIVNAIPIPDNTTNGDVIKAMFPDMEVETEGKYITLWLDEYKWVDIDYDLWNAPYKKEVEE